MKKGLKRMSTVIQNPAGSPLQRGKTLANTIVSTDKVRPPDYRWCDEEAALENSLRHKQLWVDSFFVYALVWGFGSLLTPEAKFDFDRWLKKCFDQKDIDREARQKEEESVKMDSERSDSLSSA